MLINIAELSRVFKVSPKKVLHVGAHLAGEYEDMREFGWGVDGVI
jgi:hypothetical protein